MLLITKYQAKVGILVSVYLVKGVCSNSYILDSHIFRNTYIRRYSDNVNVVQFPSNTLSSTHDVILSL